MTKQWAYKKRDQTRIKELCQTLGISPVLATLLLNRVADTKQAQAFLNPSLRRLHNPFLLPDMEKAVVRLRQAVDNKEKILVYGDRDVDGVTSIAILVRALKNLGANVVWTVPSSQGYGLHKDLLDQFFNDGARLVVTVDCGTSAVEEIAYANTLGMQVIVTDHHLPPDELPQAYAIVNPNLKSSKYPMKELAGCLTAFKVAFALMATYSRWFNKEYIVFDLETTGLHSPPDEIVEIGAVLIRNFVPVKTFDTLVRPSIPIPQEATKINGITNEMLKNAQPIVRVLPEFAKFIGDLPLVAHNAKFDMGFLRNAFSQHLNTSISNEVIDTLSLSYKLFSFPSYKLGELAKQLDIELTQAHRSLADCMATAVLFERLENQADPRLQHFLEDNLDLLTLGTIADIVPLLGENRAVVKQGLKHLLQTRKIGLRKLVEYGCKKSAPKTPITTSAKQFIQEPCDKESPCITAKEIAWNVTPLINAAGRFSKADLSVELLLTDDENKADDLIDQLITLNQERRDLQRLNVEKFLSLAQEQCDLKNDKIIFVVAEGLEHGVTGIAASQLVREFQRPAILLIATEQEASGSSRSIDCFNVVKALESCKDLLTRYGGHPAAAGLSAKPENVQELRRRLLEYAEKNITPETLKSQIEIDMELDFAQVGKEMIQELSALEPFGEGNPSPIFACRNIEIEEHSLVGAQKNHLRLRLNNPELTSTRKAVPAIAWGMGDFSKSIRKGTRVDIAFYLELGNWENQEFAQLVIHDLLLSEQQELF